MGWGIKPRRLGRLRRGEEEVYPRGEKAGEDEKGESGMAPGHTVTIRVSSDFVSKGDGLGHAIQPLHRSFTVVGAVVNLLSGERPFNPALLVY